MKKQFLTFALLTTVVAGGAIAQTYYDPANPSNAYRCDGTGPECNTYLSTQFGLTDVLTDAQDPQSDIPVSSIPEGQLFNDL